MKNKRQESAKRLYEKPVLRKIKLAAEEVLAVGCKTNQGGFNVSGTPCMANSCSKKGS